ncbi:MAG: methyl-accepting chemotaxis protein [Candidatus Omnitrophica bacterium]|nr:methyl-accepting chemotaxis protein [Candidatus Omnitrophota bacterium]MBU4488659.1 methyl-accepting chemotaxis protein [Candidatus Omnitrophota bacterium]MCG2705235.1 methyl-accepting chemotaxis protein [Candidatus Omnitrophota bacterium]
MENRRKNYFIKKEFQAKFILKFCALVALTALISASVIYLFLSQSVITVFENSRIVIKPSTEFIMPGLILSGLVSIALVGVTTIIIVLFISHRIAGPLYKIESSLEKMGDGDLSFDISFRKNDETKILSEVFNRARRRLNNMISGIKKDLKEGRDVTERIEKFKLG